MRRPRHPLVRVLLALVGLAVLGVFMVFGLVALAVFMAVGSVLFLLRLWATRGQRGAAPGTSSGAPRNGEVIEGEFVVVHERHHAHHH